MDEALETNALSMWESREELYPYGIFERTMLVLKLALITREFLKKYEKSEEERLRVHHSKAPSHETKKDELQMKRIGEVKSSSEVARELLGDIQKIVKNIPPWMRVLHVEEILRADLAKTFKAKKAEIYNNISHMSAGSLSRFLPPGVKYRRQEDALDKVLEPRVTFHGTKRKNVPLIVRHGFLKPGTSLPRDGARKGGHTGVHQVQQGSTYGRGIYSSPSPQFALDYSGWRCEPTPADEYFGQKLIVCATLMGRSVKVDRSNNLREESRALEGYDSHIANRDLEYIVFEPAQILPVYVIHLDWGEMNEMHYIPPDPHQWTKRHSSRKDPEVAPTMAGASNMAPGERKKAKEAILARASKWFPYGFGPKTKGNFVVEDVAEVSDDEEDYGDYQAMRVDSENTGKNMEYWSWVKAAEIEDGGDSIGPSLDEYSSQRKSAMYTPGKLDWHSIRLPGELESTEGDDDDDLGIGSLLFSDHGDDSPG